MKPMPETVAEKPVLVPRQRRGFVLADGFS